MHAWQQVWKVGYVYPTLPSTTSGLQDPELRKHSPLGNIEVCNNLSGARPFVLHLYSSPARKSLAPTRCQKNNVEHLYHAPYSPFFSLLAVCDLVNLIWLNVFRNKL
uniref:Uncharacterized protein n=1 Tax=Leersia perrieri TaxID=77586 RepID=A0A0D9X5N4_9ORYZ